MYNIRVLIKTKTFWEKDKSSDCITNHMAHTGRSGEKENTQTVNYTKRFSQITRCMIKTVTVNTLPLKPECCVDSDRNKLEYKNHQRTKTELKLDRVKPNIRQKLEHYITYVKTIHFIK